MSVPEEERYLAVKVAMMPRDTNPYGTIFGGVLLSYIDQAGAIGARHEIQQRGFPAQSLVTVALDRVEFHEPVFVGDTVSFWTEVRRIGTTSIDTGTCAANGGHWCQEPMKNCSPISGPTSP